MSIKSPAVSVIILANGENSHLLETIASLRQQAFIDIEVLICHSDNSTGLNMQCKSQQYESIKDNRFRLLIEENLNIVETLNLGIQEAKGKYIAFLKAGDLWHSDKLSKQVSSLEGCLDIGLIHSWSTIIDDKNQSLGKTLKNQLHGRVESEILERNQINFSSVIVRRDCLDAVGLFDPDLNTGADWDMWIRFSRSYNFMAIAETLVYQRQLKNQDQDSWLNVEKDFQGTIEKAYQDVPDQLLYLKPRSYGYASLSLARQVLQHKNFDPEIAYHYCRQALEHFPRISLSPEFIQLSAAVITLHYLKSDRYLYPLSSMQAIRTRSRVLIHRFKTSIGFALDWILEEEEKEQETKKEETKPEEWDKGFG